VLKEASAREASFLSSEDPGHSAPPDEIEAVTVTGFRASLTHARDLKRMAIDTRDIVLAEDIAAFPDLNLAESLQRLPGVTITRDAGEGRQIALRGLGPDFTRAKLNGMEVLSNTSSGFDNRGSVSRTRAFDYSIFASELFNRVTVRKSYAVDQDEGGIGGTVELRTAKPFDYPGFKTSIAAKVLTNGNTRTVTPRMAGLISNTWGDFGALVSVAYSENDINEYGYRNWGWSPINVGATNVGLGVSAADRDRLIFATGDNRVMAPQAQTYSTWLDHRERLGGTFTLQYRPSDRLKLDLGLLYGRLSNDRDEFALAAAGVNPLTGDIIGSQRLNAVTIRDGDLVQAAFTGVDLRTEHKHSIDSTEFVHAGLNGTYQVNDRLGLSGMVGYSNSDFKGPVFDKIFLQTRGKSFAYDFRSGRSGTNAYGFDIADPAQWELMRADTREDSIVNSFTTGKLDLAYAVASGSRLRTGAQYKTFRNDGYQRRARADYDPTVASRPAIYIFSDRSIAPYAVGDVEATFERLRQNRDLTATDDQPGADYSVTEKTFAAYVDYQAEGDIAARRVRAQAGLRYYTTDLTSAGMVTVGGGLKPAIIKHSYDGVLPAFNLTLDLSDRLVARLGANRDISRPSLSDLRAAGNVDSNPFGGTISAGNPNLRPFMADSIEASLEFYQGRTGYLAVSIFYKSMDSFITVETAAVPYGSTGYPLQFLNPGQTPASVYNFNRPVNGDGATIGGVELAVQKDFDTLPAPFDKLGVVANLTFATGETDALIGGRTVSLSLPQLSKWTSNATLYYETARWGARISSAYRDGYLDGFGGAGNVGSGYRAANNVDFAAHYNAPGGLKLVIEGINLSDQAIDQYTDIRAKRVLAHTRSGRTFTFGATYEF
jgi:iron complex outermembrane receptor protein